MSTPSEDVPRFGARAGLARVRYESAPHGPRLTRLDQCTPLRLLFPRPPVGDPPLAVLLNTGGGLVGGDRLAIEIEAGDRAALTATTAAAEKVYRSAGPTVEITIVLRAGDDAWLEWLPQETILFDRARFSRRTRIERAGGGRVMFAEMTVFGRHASGERFVRGQLIDRVELCANDQPGFVDISRLKDEPGALIDHRFGFASARASALLLYGADDAARHLDAVREVLRAAPGPAGATVVRNVLVVRWLSTTPAMLRRSLASMVALIRHRTMGLRDAMPQVWWT